MEKGRVVRMKKFTVRIIIKLVILLELGLWCVISVPPAYANNVAVTNVQLLEPDTSAGTVKVTFTLSQENPFGDLTYDGKSYSDYIWVFVKYSTVPVDESIGYKHAKLISGTGYQTPTSDNKGVFIKASDAGVSGTTFSVLWKFLDDGVAIDKTVNVKVCAIEMVKIPLGSFYYNVHYNGSNIGTAAVADWSSCTVENGYCNNYGAGSEVLVSATSHVPVGNSTADWPNGYGSFYIMKYEVSQGQYADFLNMLSASDATSRFGSYTDYEHTITYASGNPYGSRYAASKPSRASAYISWDDCLAYASWAALRPMTEMEFEKAARGTSSGTFYNATYPWGEDDPTTGNEVYVPLGHVSPYGAYKYYANFNNVVTTNGGPTNVGNYLSGDIERPTTAQTGASPYGVADLAGNLWEHVINCDKNDTGDAAATVVLTPAIGDGALHTNYLTDLNWSKAAKGKGLRGGSWSNDSGSLRVSYRNYAGITITGRHNNYGFRAARTP